jgi:ribosome-associated protein
MFIEQLLNEVSFNFSRSGGKGGQNVNKVETKVELIFNIKKSDVLTIEQKEMLLNNLKNKIDKEGNLRIVSQTERTQLANRKKALEKFDSMIEKALKKKKKRKKTRIPKLVKLKVLEQKRRHGEMKRDRRKVTVD